MSLDQIRRLKLLRDLEKSPKPTPKSEIKHRTMTTISQTDNLRKLNKNKKYMLEEERNTEIQRNNRLLYEKIMGHFQSLKETTQHRNKWRKRKKKVKLVTNQEEQSEANRSNIESLKFRSRVKTIRESRIEEVQTLFLGMAQIDGFALKVKISLSKEKYLLLAKNGDLCIELEMDYAEYMRIHKGMLGGNPCNIFDYLVIEGNEIKFRQKGQKLQKPGSVKIGKTKTAL